MRLFEDEWAAELLDAVESLVAVAPVLSEGRCRLPPEVSNHTASFVIPFFFKVA
jgi:hypothetical protein